MKILVNGEERDLPAGITLDGWLEESGLGQKHIVVEFNERILTRAEWADTVLQQGDRLEIVTFVGGG